jgi:hypothetical protein
VERVDLTRLRKAERQRWRSGDEWDDSAPKIAVGQFTDGRWYVRQYGPATRACAYAGEHAEHLAYGTARRWMRTLGGQWVEA